MLQEVALESLEAERDATLELFDGLDTGGDELRASRAELLDETRQLSRLPLRDLQFDRVEARQQRGISRRPRITVE